VIVAAPLGVHVRLDVAQALPTGELRLEQSHELIPAADLAQALAHVVGLGQLLEFMSRDHSQELPENRFTMCQGIIPLVFAVFVGTFIASTSCGLSLFHSRLWDSSGTEGLKTVVGQQCLRPLLFSSG
jgi:hypothetical protein